ncbi:MAG: hypothetical protein IJ626_01775, partial [Muribaculaceae bacterium]|nr:hypothetical protein [Muribaculaceae bacterium]
FEQYRDNPDYLDVQYDPETNGLMATHREHNTHPNDNQRSFGYMAEFSHLPESERGLTGDQLEKECQKELYRMGHKAILRQEGMRGSDGNELAALDMDLNNVTMDIFTPRGEKWANGIWDKSKQIGRVFEQTEVSSNSLCVFFYDASMYSNEKMLSEIAGYKEKVQRTRNAAQNIEKIYCVVRGASSIITYDI